ncbi:metallophosphoesterase family protein [Acetobacter sp.]|uniref:metallophosphoesterase family protein n=1 Tax=Acetobacter sp. TaxID=440 RepID=UPI0039ECBDE6
MRFVHSSDWQIGKTFNFAPDDRLHILQQARIDVISRLGELARQQGASDVLVAGDIYDYESPTDRTLRQPLQRMREFPDLRWHLIPGNHDFHQPNGVWERVKRLTLPETVYLHLSPEPVALTPDQQVWLLPSVLMRRHTTSDPTAWMDEAATPEGAMRIGLAHGSVREFGGDGDQPNLIAIDRPARAGLAYLALGDWHGFNRIGDRCAYSGTPESDGFAKGGDGGGSALVVSIDGPNAVPTIVPHRVGHFSWHTMQDTVMSFDDIDALENRLRSLDVQKLSSVLVSLAVDGHLTLEDMTAFEERILGDVGDGLCLLRMERMPELVTSDADLATFGEAGVVSRAAARLQEMSATGGPQQQHARAALQRLAVLWQKEKRA